MVRAVGTQAASRIPAASLLRATPFGALQQRLSRGMEDDALRRQPSRPRVARPSDTAAHRLFPRIGMVRQPSKLFPLSISKLHSYVMVIK